MLLSGRGLPFFDFKPNMAHSKNKFVKRRLTICLFSMHACHRLLVCLFISMTGFEINLYVCANGFTYILYIYICFSTWFTQLRKENPTLPRSVALNHASGRYARELKVCCLPYSVHACGFRSKALDFTKCVMC